MNEQYIQALKDKIESVGSILVFDAVFWLASTYNLSGIVDGSVVQSLDLGPNIKLSNGSLVYSLPVVEE